ncbi:hypothetical protein C4544_04070 [candidate division WS5 bacterium]|uniref:PRTase-CE domain-containing protein n=1 Tax=candidate division WS5 bacterium TaxID=2093353 RepID=A0A419DCZ0_9BACT|nr:MAG: hypothetical protein C4544_04070 [candidate division WS5 bacterium]
MIDVNIINRVKLLFDELNWKSKGDDNTINKLFDRFVEMLYNLSEDERNLVIEMTKDFLLCNTLVAYNDTFNKILDGLNDSVYENVREIIALPLVSPEDADKSKSGDFCLYLFKGKLAAIAREKNIKFNQYVILDALNKYHGDRENALIFFIDDFIGSGITANKAIKYYNTKLRVSTDRACILALVSQKSAIEYLEDPSVKIIVGFMRFKGIYDSTRISDKYNAYLLMDAIENKLNIREIYKRGYRQTEALVSMIRCPNNTFPVYWCRHRVDGKTWPAPFER